MAQDHELPQQRFELKYLIDGRVAPRMRDFLGSHLVPDEYGVGQKDFSYPVHTVYLDSNGLETYQASLNGTKNRFKLRLRYYSEDPESPVFFEVKGRVDNCILKRRCPVRRAAVPLLLAGHLPEPEHLFSTKPKNLFAFHHFHHLMQRLGARPKAHNHYMREAWVTPDNNAVRVTFDRNILHEPHFLPETVTEMKRPVRVFPEFVVVELKFTERFPNWFKDLVRHFNLMQFSSAKYAEGITLMGESRFQEVYRPNPSPVLVPRRRGLETSGLAWSQNPAWRETNPRLAELETAAAGRG